MTDSPTAQGQKAVRNAHVLYISVRYQTDRPCLRATAACNFRHRNTCIVHVFACSCASRYSGVQFFDIAPSKSGPNTSCFVHFHFQMCFSPQRRVFLDILTSKSDPNTSCFVHFHFQMCVSPQRRAFFGHRIFEKWSEHLMFCAFSLPNAFFATAACNFWTS